MAPSLLPFGGAHWTECVARHAYSRPDGVAFRFEGRTLTWAVLHRRVGHLASALAVRGVTPGARVAVLMTNRPEYVETVLAATTLGAIAVPVNFRLAPGEVAYILDDCGATMLVTDAGLAPLAAQAVTATGVEAMPTLVVGAAGSGPAGVDAGDDYEAALAAEDGPPPAFDVDERDVALLMYTSGTTGRPKGAMLTHLNLLMQAVTAIRTSRLVDDDSVAMCSVPLFHIAGTGGLVPSLLTGAPTVLMPSATFDPGALLDLVEGEGVTGLFLVPAQWQALCAHPDATRRSASLKVISWGAAPATVTLLELMGRTFPDTEIISVFGQTEMSPVTTSLPSEDAIRKIGSVGRPVPTIAARVVDEEMRDVPPGEVGEIVYRGPTLMAGYWNKPEATALACAGGWFHSGDLVRVDGEGFIYVVDRKKDMIISGGENIYCAEVEGVLAGHPAVADVAVVGAGHPRWGETPIAVVVAADPGAPPTLEDLTSWATDRLAGYKKPTGVVILDELPRNASGKVLKHQLRERYGAGIA